MSKLKIKYRLTKSPFMLASIAGLVAIALDFLWAVSVLIDHYLGWGWEIPVHWLLVIAFPICFIVVCRSMVKYYRNGYLREERRCEMDNVKQKIRKGRLSKC